MFGRRPVAPDVYAAAQKDGIEVVALPTPELCERLAELTPKDINAVLHVTC